LLDLSSSQDTKELQLLRILSNEKELTERQLTKDIYGAFTPAALAAFQQLKARLQAKLLNHLFFLDHTDPRHLVTRRYEMAVLHLLHQATALTMEGEYGLAEQRLRRCLLLANRDGFIAYAVQAARQLRTLYVTRRKPGRYREMVTELARLQQLQAWEDEAEHLNAEFRVAAGSTVATQHRLLPQLPAYLGQLEALHAQAQTFNTYWLLYRARLFYEQLRGNFLEIMRITAQAEQDLRAGQLNERRFDYRYNHFMAVYGHLMSRQSLRGLELAQHYLPAFHASSTNWFAFQENHCLLALQAGDWDHARRVLDTVTANPSYPKQQAAARQRWDLYRTYLEFLLPGPGGRSARQTVAQWALMLPDFNRDKRGYHVAVLIVQLLYFLQRRDLDAVMVRLERLRKYQQLHLHEEPALRSRLFLRLLMLLLDWDFNPRVCAQRGQSLLGKLQAAPLPGEAYAEIEVVPYEKLWELTLQLLQQGPPLAANAAPRRGRPRGKSRAITPTT
jgi:hypothetical protein